MGRQQSASSQETPTARRPDRLPELGILPQGCKDSPAVEASTPAMPSPLSLHPHPQVRSSKRAWGTGAYLQSQGSFLPGLGDRLSSKPTNNWTLNDQKLLNL